MNDPPKKDTAPSMAAQPPTTRIEALTDRKLLEMLVGSVKDTNAKIDNVSDKVDTLSLNVEILQDDGRDTKARIIRLEGWKEGVDNRLNSNSQRAKGASQVDLDLQAELAKERSAREDLAKKVDENTTVTNEVKASLKTNTDATLAIKTAVVDGVAGFLKRHPLLEKTFVALILAVLTAGGVWVNSLVHK